MTTATDHKNNLNSSNLKKKYARTLRVETIANLAGGTAEVAIVAQPSTGFLNGKFYPDGSPTEDTEDCLDRITVGLTRSKSLTLLVSPLDMMRLIGMAQVIATIAYGIQGLRKGETTWDWPTFNANPEQENLEQMSRWSLNTTPSWSYHPLATANKYHDHQTNQPKSVRYRLILVRASDLDWLRGDRLKDLQAQATAGHKWIPARNGLHTCACHLDCTMHAPGVYWHRLALNKKSHRCRASTFLMGGEYLQHWSSPPTYQAPKKHQYVTWKPPHTVLQAQNPRSPEEEARDILATAAKNQAEDGPQH